MPAGFEVMVALACPAPIARKLTLRVCVATLNVATTVVAALSVTLHVAAVPVQPPPDQPANVEPGAGAAVSVTTGSVVVRVNGALQTVPQLIAEVESLTVPVPVPFFVTLRVSGACLRPCRRSSPKGARR